MASPRLFLDEDVRLGIAAILRDRSFDAVHVLEVDRQGVSDEEQLAYASDDGRTILTHNVADFVELDRAWREAGKEHAGIVVSRQLPLRELLHLTVAFLSASSDKEMRCRLAWLPEFG